MVSLQEVLNKSNQTFINFKTAIDKVFIIIIRSENKYRLLNRKTRAWTCVEKKVTWQFTTCCWNNEKYRAKLRAPGVRSRCWRNCKQRWPKNNTVYDNISLITLWNIQPSTFLNSSKLIFPSLETSKASKNCWISSLSNFELIVNISFWNSFMSRLLD